MKQCKDCGQFKPYDPTQKRQSKACGFVGLICWDCFVIAQRTKMQDRTKMSRPIKDRTYGALVRKAQSALDALANLKDTPIIIQQRSMLQWDLERAQNKADRFGADAYDFTPAEIKRANHDND